MMGNHYLLNPAAGFAAVFVSKNGCTSLKARVLMDCGVLGDVRMANHDRIGYDTSSPFLGSVRDGIPENMHTFAVGRDRVERIKTVFKHFALGTRLFRISSRRL
jgi:hypothetical protein